MTRPLLRRSHAHWVVIIGFAGISVPVAAEDLFFEIHIQPVFRVKCAKCHGEKTQKAGLNVLRPSALRTGSESGRVIVAGKPHESSLFEMVSQGEMPPQDNEPLTGEEVELIRKWIADGAKFRDGGGERVVTQHEIGPLMLRRCAACHGERRREADLDLRTRASMLKGGRSGPAVVVGKLEESLLIRRIKAEEMPPRRKLKSASVKPIEATELAMLEKWIADGMPESPVGPDVATTEPDPLVSDEDRHFWSFRPPKAGAVPIVAHPTRVRNPIDAFVLRKLEAVGLSLSPEAGRATLLRRVHFDLTGLPPPPDAVDEFVNDPDQLAWEKLIERLLASPRYGERWAAHWLDVAGYADSEGGQDDDKIRPHIWRYRDYVVRAFNTDKPYDRFLHEQIAGDELADYENAELIDDEIYDNLTATAFLATAEDRTFANITNFVPDRLEVIADEIQVFSTAVLGLTVNCARCHSHKFDPIPQRDYYRLSAIFKDGLDEYDWLKPQGARSLGYVTTAERKAWETHDRRIAGQIEPLKEQLEREQDEDAKRRLEEQIGQLEARRTPEPRIRATWSRGVPSPTYILRRGNYSMPGRLVGPGVPSVLTDGRTPFEVAPPWPGAKKTGRRLALARWLTQPDHPLTARVMVNRIWKHHFGAGIVTTMENFGTTGASPTHPELLDWLAVQFVRHGWSIKQLHRLILTSSTYRQSSRVTPENQRLDSDGGLLSRMPLTRMDAEVVRDSLLAAAGQLDLTPGGPPDAVDERPDGLVTSKRTARGWRRSIYVLHRRRKIPTILERFDLPEVAPNCTERGVSIVAPQALHLLNNAMVFELAGHFANRIRDQAGSNPAMQIDRIHLVAHGRRPSDDERLLVLATLEELAQRWLAETQEDAVDAERTAAERALVNYCHAVMNSAEFLYID